MKYQNILNDKIVCLLCPRMCKLKKGQRGFCYVRRSDGENIVLDTYGYNTGLAIDPIEKKPLYNFLPESKVLSFGTLGCNMGCLFCQNHHITKVKKPIEECDRATSSQIVSIAKRYLCDSVAFTYNEPVIFFEYALATARLCRAEGIKTIAVTSGYINPEPAEEFFNLMDAANIDLKGFSEQFYLKNCLAHLRPVLDTIKYVKNHTNCHLELTTMIIEGENDHLIKDECRWILDNLGDSVPLHLSAFTPKYKFSNRTPTSYAALKKAYDTAVSMGLKYVYTGNARAIDTTSTYCKNCGEILIKRDGYNTLENNIIKGMCKFCAVKCDGVFE